MPNLLEDGFDAEVRVRHVRWAAPDGGFAVLSVEAPDGDELTVAGPVAHLSEGDRARVVGHWSEHDRYGLQVQAEAAYELDPDDAAGALKYLTTISRIGKRRAKQLVDRYGPSVLEQIDADPDAAFAALPRMSASAAAAAAESWRERRALRDLYVLLAPHGAGWLAAPLHERHGPSAVGIVRTDPYRLTEEHGIGFETADAIARAHGVAEDSPGRYRAALIHVLQTAERRSGHTYLPVDELRRGAAELVGPLPDGLIEDLGAAHALAVERDRAALPATWEAEAALAGDFASTTKRISSGETASRMSAACCIISWSMPRRPAVSTITMSWTLVRACSMESLATFTGSPTPLPGSGAKIVAPACPATTCS